MSGLRRLLAVTQPSLGLHTQIRCFHATSLALKKKQNVSSSFSHLEDTSDAFRSDQVPEDDELFRTTTTELPRIDPLPRISLPVRKTPEILRARNEMFEGQRTSILKILGRSGKLRQPPRKSAIVRLVALTETKAQLEQLLEVIVEWRNAALLLSPNTCDEFIRRCIHLKCPELALKALLNRPMYGVNISSLSSARQLLKALAHPRTGGDPTAALRDCLAFAEVFPLYGLPSASKDVISCAILARLIAQQVPNDKSSLQQKEKGEAEVMSYPFWEIMGELKAAVAAWEGVGATRPKNMLPGLRGNVEKLLGTVRRKGGTPQPWLQQLRTEILHHFAELNTSN